MRIIESDKGFVIELTDREADALITDLVYTQGKYEAKQKLGMPFEDETAELLTKLSMAQEEVERGRFGCE